MAYQLLSETARKRTEYLVIESAVDTEQTFIADIPLELLSLLDDAPILDQDETQPKTMFGYLLGWMVLFDLFKDAVGSHRLCFDACMLNGPCSH